MSASTRKLLWLVIGVGTAVRIVVAFSTVGNDFDIGALRLVATIAQDDLFHLYGTLKADEALGGVAQYRWVYPPGFLPLSIVAVAIGKATGLPFHGLVQLFPIAADAAIAWLVQDFLGHRGASDRTRLAAVALVALGPSFAVVSGYQGQIDSVAILPAVAALWLWETRNPPHRAVWAGLLIGVAATVKAPPILMVLALLPSVRSVREAVTLVGCAGGVLLATLAPFLVADSENVVGALRYRGGPGLGGFSMLVQPDLLRGFLLNDFSKGLSGASQTLYDATPLIVGAAVAGLAALVLRFRPRPTEAAVLVWLTLTAFNPNSFPQYVIWGLPFFLMAGHLGKVALIQAFQVPVLVLFYSKPWESEGVVLPYIVLMTLFLIGFLVALFLAATRVAREAPPPRAEPAAVA